ncbi:T9SS type A sorting domain-containing protein [bacterium AH-315-M05]|nr:T9SS type A sorting domain-containing protein [bacterium AH-315-M05]MBN4051208.1 T9SS type A sorting domain-containing protein [bacterium AH-315-M05]
MKKLLLSIPAVVLVGFAYAQCTELFISEYVEGSNNNKAMEIYNPTPDTINLSNYRIIRWSNGSTTSDQDIRYIQLLSGTVPPYGTYVAILDRRDPAGTGVDTILFAELLNFGNTCNAGFYSPCYTCFNGGDRVMPFNGDDAIALEKDLGGNNWTMVDLFGLIGERPETSMGGTGAGWTDTPNYWDGIGAYWTKDQTLIRKYNIDAGVTSNPGAPYILPGNFNPTVEWDSLPRNTFDRLGFHDCICQSTSSCNLEIIIDSVVSPSACGGNDGAIYISILGDSMQYDYDWSNGDIIEDITGLSATTYTLSITGIAYCEHKYCSISITVTDPGAPTLVITDTTMVTDSTDGSATVTPSGGIPPYDYFWNTSPPQFDSTATGLVAGTYTVTVFDSAGCMSFITVTISGSVGIDEIDSGVRLNVFPNPSSNNRVTITSGKVLKSVEVYNLLGQMVYQSGPIENRKYFMISLNEINSGVYFMKVYFMGGGEITEKIVVK